MMSFECAIFSAASSKFIYIFYILFKFNIMKMASVHSYFASIFRFASKLCKFIWHVFSLFSSVLFVYCESSFASRCALCLLYHHIFCAWSAQNILSFFFQHSFELKMQPTESEQFNKLAKISSSQIGVFIGFLFVRFWVAKKLLMSRGKIPKSLSIIWCHYISYMRISQNKCCTGKNRGFRTGDNKKKKKHREWERERGHV